MKNNNNMKVLWLTANAFPEVYDKLGLESPVNTGWVHSSAYSLLEVSNDVSLGIAVVLKSIQEYKELKINGINHFLIPFNLRNENSIWECILNSFNPQIVHVQGTEYPHLYSFLKARNNQKVLISIQGLVSVYSRYYYANLSLIDIIKSTTIRDIVRVDNIITQKYNMQTRGKVEIDVISKADAIIGRTEWDYAHIKAINPKLKYYHCDETLRGVFYQDKWSWNNCHKYRIFVSQAHYPLKGLHQLLRALPYVINQFPNTELHIAGHNFFKGRGYKINGYGKYINKLIKKYKLSSRIYFTGLLDETQMKKEFMQANIFICPSSIENSPNSLGEAQIIGTPVIASFVGGIPNMVSHRVNGLLYRFDEPELLASHIIELFNNKDLCESLSNEGIKSATIRHDKKNNSETLLNIYKNLI